MEKTDSADETQADEEMVLSDEESVSLLQDCPACPSGEAAEDIAAAVSDPQGDKINLETNEKRKDTPKIRSRSDKVPNKKMLHKRNEKGETLLHKACQRSNLAQVRMLLQAGIDVNAEDYTGWIPLHEASAAGDESVVEELLRAGANVNARSCDGVTPLQDAVSAGYYQVAKLLLENGSNRAHQNLGGLTALDMTEDPNIIELLTTFHRSSDSQGISPQLAARCCDPGPEVSGVDPIQSDAGREPIVVRLRQNDLANTVRCVAHNSTCQSGSQAVSVVLEGVRRKQAEISTWPLRDVNDLGRHKEALLHTQSVLMDGLAKQRSEKNDLSHKFSLVPHHLRQRVLRSRLCSLASTQRHLVRLLQKQVELEEAYATAKANVSPQSLNRRGRIAASCNRRQLLVTDSHTANPSGPRAALQLNAPTKRKSAKDDSGGLRQLVLGGALPQGGALQVTLKGQQHVALVSSDGLIMSKGKSYRAAECWLESILGHNIPVSAAYALDKVTFRDKPLSYYLLNMQGKENPSELQRRDDKDDSAQQDPELLSPHYLLRKIKTIRLVSSEEMLPNAVMDVYWDRLLRQNHADFGDWEREL